MVPIVIWRQVGVAGLLGASLTAYALGLGTDSNSTLAHGASEDQAKPSAAPQHVGPHSRFPHVTGIDAGVTFAITGVFADPKTGEHVRHSSVHVNILRENTLLGQLSGLWAYGLESTESLKLDLSGVPSEISSTGVVSSEKVGVEAVVRPKAGYTWGTVKDLSQVDFAWSVNAL